MFNKVINRKNINIITSYNKFYYMLFAVISVAITSLNIGGPYIIHFIDIMWPLNPIQSIYNSFNIWSYSNYGYFNGINIFNFQYFFIIALLSYLPVYLQELILLSLLQFIGAVYTYKIFKEFILKNDSKLTKFLSFAAAFPIIFSNYYWWDFIPIGFFLISFGAMFIYYLMAFLDSYDKNNSFNYKFLFLMAFASILSFSSNAPVNANLIIIALIMPLFIISKNTGIRKMIIFYILMLTIILFTNLWWIIPSYMSTIFQNTSLGGLGNAYILILNSHNASFFNILEYDHIMSPYIELAGNLKINSVIYNVSIYSSIILLLIADGVFFMSKRNLRKGYFISLFSLIFLDIIMMGINSPLKSMEIYLIDTNGILSEYLRGNPGSLYLALFFILTILIIISVYILLKSYMEAHSGPKHKVLVILVLALLIFSFIAVAPQNYDGYAVPHYPYRARMAIPSFDSQFANFVEKNTGQSYTLLYPGGFLEQNITHGYDSYDILPSLIPQSLLIDDPSDIMLENIYNYIGSESLSENFSYYLYSQNIKYIVVEGDLGGNYPFGFSPPPDYHDILQHLNNTNGIKMVKKIGPDYIYEANIYPGSMISKAKIFSNNNIIDGDIIPIANITWKYFNDTFENRTVYEPNGTYNNGINVNINKTSWDIISNLSYRYTGAEPIFYNSVPLNINTSTDSVLIFKLKGNNNTVITPNALTSSNITLYSILNSTDHVPTGYPYNDLRDNNNTATLEYGCDHYLMSNNTMTMIINLNSAARGKTIHYIYFSPVPLNRVYGSDLNFTIESIELGTYFSSAYGMFHVSHSFNYNYNYTLNYVKKGYTDYLINAKISKGTGPILLSLFTSYSPYWEVKDISGVSSYKLIRLNNDTTGIVIYPKPGYNNIEFNLFYGPQKNYVNIEYSLIAAYSVFFISMLILYKREWTARIIKKIIHLRIFRNP
jgi:hypothetical protein